VWAGLVLAWLASAFLLLRWLWRRAKGLLEALDEAAGAADRLEAGQWAAQGLAEVALFASSAELGRRREARRARIASRRARRRARHQAAYDSWAVLAGRRDA
jgi:hypothetical protein